MPIEEFSIGIPTQRIKIDTTHLTPEMKRCLVWWQKPGPRTDCPFVNVHGEEAMCAHLCGRIFADIDDVSKRCPFKVNYSEKVITELVLLLLNRCP